MLVLGIDPGTVRVGYGLIEAENNKFSHIFSGIFKVESAIHNQRLKEIGEEISRVLGLYKPDLVGIEKLYFTKNKKTGLLVAEARGVLMSAVCSSGIPFLEIHPMEVKSSLCGDGRASKAGVAKMVGHFLNIDVGKKIDDATDGLAVAIAAAGVRNF